MANSERIEIKLFLPKRAWERVEELAKKTGKTPNEVLSKLIDAFKEEKTPKRRRKTLGDM